MIQPLLGCFWMHSTVCTVSSIKAHRRAAKCSGVSVLKWRNLQCCDLFMKSEKCRVKTVYGYHLDLEYSCVDTKIYVFLLIIVQCVKTFKLYAVDWLLHNFAYILQWHLLPYMISIISAVFFLDQESPQQSCSALKTNQTSAKASRFALCKRGTNKQ